MEFRRFAGRGQVLYILQSWGKKAGRVIGGMA